MTIQQQSFQITAQGMIKELKKRNMEGFFCETNEDAVKLILSMIPKKASVTWGGSESIKECGLLDAIKANDYAILDRSTAKTLDEQRHFFAKAVLADAFLMSTNAITLHGELVNIDGSANRLACLLHGPKEVYVIAGMNKLVADIPAAYGRIKNIACPANTIRLNRKTPCTLTGKCEDCFSPDCICSQTVITRRSSQPNRIKVILVAQNLGY